MVVPLIVERGRAKKTGLPLSEKGGGIKHSGRKLNELIQHEKCLVLKNKLYYNMVIHDKQQNSLPTPHSLNIISKSPYCYTNTMRNHCGHTDKTIRPKIGEKLFCSNADRIQILDDIVTFMNYKYLLTIRERHLKRQ